MKKMLITLALGAALLAAPGIASARVDVSIGIGMPFPGVVVAPPPVVVGPPVVYAPPPPVVYGPPVYYGRSYPRPVYYGRPGKYWRRHHWKHHH